MELKTVNDIPDVAGKRVFVRASLNVPMRDEGTIYDTFRVDEILPTVDALTQAGARVILAGHLGRDPEDTLKPVADYIGQTRALTFCKDIFADQTKQAIEAMENGEIVMLENLRHWDGEEENDPAFAKHLASFADIYVNEAFAASHRAHASIVGVPQYLPAYGGLQFADEVKHLELVRNPKHPFVFILGGAKFQTKIPLMEKFCELADTLFVGGALANDFYKECGYEIGNSHTDFGKGEIDIAHLLEKENIVLPRDVRVRTAEGEARVRHVQNVKETDTIMDAGPESIAQIKELVKDAELILWNGPLGNYEEGFDEATRDLLTLLSEQNATTILGGGDTATLVSQMQMKNAFDFVSTGGGAMLDYLADGELPGLGALVSSM